MRNKSLSLLLLLVLALNVAGQQSAGKSQPNIDRLREVITLLASDKLDGRRTGTDGANQAAKYVASEFKRLGLKPGAKDYLQSFPYVAGVDLGKANAMSFKPNAIVIPVPLQVGVDWMPLGFTANGKTGDSPVVFVGYGITAADLKYDDYAGVDVSGKIALALSGSPDGDNPHGQFGRYEDVRWKAIAAKDKGAKALLVIASEDNFKEDRLAKLQFDNMAGEAGLPVAVISKESAYRILSETFASPAVAQSWNELSKRIIDLSKGRTGFSVPVKNAILSMNTEVSRRNSPAANVVGIMAGSDPKLKSEAIVIGAHYDHLGRGGEGSLAARAGDIHHGADDNASGVAGVLELARIFSQKAMKPKRTLVFVAFSGEEEGLIGSNYYVNHPIIPLPQTVAMVNMDMIGRLKDNKLIVGGIGTSITWRELVGSLNTSTVAALTKGRENSNGSVPIGLGGFDLTLNEDGYGPSDHSSFYSKQVPVLFFWTGTHEDYHKPSDTADKINFQGEARILSMVIDLLRAIDQNEQRPVYAVAKSESTGRSMGFKVSLGTIPNYAESTDGLLLDGVRDDSPASKAGLKAGDVIVKLAGREVHNVYDYTYALGEMKAGEEYDVELMRGSERLKLKIIPAARK